MFDELFPPVLNMPRGKRLELGQVFEHEGPLPHPAQDQTQ
jgi:hypothetical protein